jgi:hypothetical protein
VTPANASYKELSRSVSTNIVGHSAALAAAQTI